MASFKQRLQNLDAHSTISNEFRIRTGYGAILSTITVISILYLTKTELDFNLQIETVSKVQVKPTSPAGLQMEFDITFPKIPCALLSIDAADPTGQPQSLHIDKTHRIWKHRLDENGKLVGRRSRFEMGNTLTEESHVEEMVKKKLEEMEDLESYDDEVQDEEQCGSCYGAADASECCNTCDDVKRAYQRKGWHLDDLSLVKQCKHSRNSKEEVGEGCNISGNVALGTGGGNLHIVPGRGLENFGHEKTLSLADVLTSAFETYNVTHKINKLRFGKSYPGAIFQLDGQERVIQDAYGMYQYYLQVVPASYKKLYSDKFRRKSIETHQFAVTEHLRHVNPGSNRGLPGVYFFYELSPLHVEVEETRRGWTHFFTSVCAVVGGIFTFMSMMDKVIFETTRPKGDSLGF